MFGNHVVFFQYSKIIKIYNYTLRNSSLTHLHCTHVLQFLLLFAEGLFYLLLPFTLPVFPEIGEWKVVYELFGQTVYNLSMWTRPVYADFVNFLILYRHLCRYCINSYNKFLSFCFLPVTIIFFHFILIFPTNGQLGPICPTTKVLVETSPTSPLVHT